MTDEQRAIHVVMQERTGLLRKAGSVFLTIAVLTASIAIMSVLFFGGAPDPLLAGALILAALGIGLAVLDWALRMARRGVRASWRTLRARRARRHDPVAIRARIAVLEAELETLRGMLARAPDEAARQTEVAV